jgi:hypothetical protein
VSPNDPLPPALRAFAERQLGPLSSTRFCGWPHAESAVWALRGSRRAFLKVFRQPRKFVQERRAYRAWLPQLTATEAYTPHLIGESETLRALLMSALPGTLPERAPLTPSQSLKAYRQAGAFLRALHTLPFRDDDPLSLAEAMRYRAQAWLGRAEGIVARDLITWVGEQAAEVAVTLTKLGAVRVPCHRDYSPRNWLVEISGKSIRLSVIDFEHSRPDFWLFDTEKLASSGWSGVAERAFWEGYGRTLMLPERRLLERHAALTALSTVVWARERRDTAFEAQGWAQLSRLRERAR